MMLPIIYEDESGAYDSRDIEALIKENDFLKQSAIELDKENARLRTELEDIAYYCDHVVVGVLSDICGCPGKADILYKKITTARAALDSASVENDDETNT